MIIIKNKHALEKMAVAGQLLAKMFELLVDVIKPNITTIFIDSWIDNYLRNNNLVSSMRGFMGYKHVSCISINDEVVHGIPGQKQVKCGDLVKVDVCASFKGYCADMARCFFVGDMPGEIKKFINVAQRALDLGIEQAKIGNKLTDISSVIGKEIIGHGYGVVRDFAGHGIGKNMHEDPEILNYGEAGSGPIIRQGMAFAIEPMITQAKHDVYVTNDGWTVKTVDKSLAAHVEDTIIITEQGPKIITRVI